MSKEIEKAMQDLKADFDKRYKELEEKLKEDDYNFFDDYKNKLDSNQFNISYKDVGIIGCNNIYYNAFETKEEANKFQNRMIAYRVMKEEIARFNGDWKPDWTNRSERKGIFSYNCAQNKYMYFYDITYVEFENDLYFDVSRSEEDIKALLYKLTHYRYQDKTINILSLRFFGEE